MGQQQPLLLGDDGCRHGAGEVVDNYHRIGGMVLQIGLKGSHHLTGELVEVIAFHPQTHVGTRNLEVVEERILERSIIGTAGKHQLAVYVGTLLTLSSHHTQHWCHLDEIRPGTYENTDVHPSLNNSLIPPMLPSIFVAS